KPGSLTFSYATFGCNFKCSFCQNWQISQTYHEVEYVEPERIVELAIQNGCEGIAHTYTEPTVFFEYAFDIAKLAHKKGLFNIFVTNGYIEDEPLKDIRPYLDAANIDLKGFNSDFYKKLCGAELEKVLQGIKKYAELGIKLEITNLIIPGKNDDPAEIRELCKWIVDSLGDKTSLHLSRYRPSHNLNIDPTPIDTLKKAGSIAKEEGIKFVYIGNVFGEGEDTHCYKCGSILIKREGYNVSGNRISKGRCPDCGAESCVVS
ncbi:MAG: AmmeMemoRadiSam system radical SAM enzyme, partial [Candidatus Hermodarchaeia archaeon]